MWTGDEPAPMADVTGNEALRGALEDWRRHAGALFLVVAAFSVAELVGTPVARYGAWLFTFAVWMLWFVLTAIEWIRRAEF